MKGVFLGSTLLLAVLLSGCSSSSAPEQQGSAQSEKQEPLKPDQKPAGERFKTELGPQKGLTIKGQRVTTTSALKKTKNMPSKAKSR